jgi:hypothetical protein
MVCYSFDDYARSSASSRNVERWIDLVGWGSGLKAPIEIDQFGRDGWVFCYLI